MAEIYDLQDNDDELSQFDEVVKDTPEVEAPQEDEVPEKYRGKSAKEIIKMHQEAEKLAGRHAQEVGELRKITDDIIRQQVTAKHTEQPQAQEIDFFDDPKEAVKRVVESHPDVVAARRSAAELRQMQTASLLSQNHPDFKEVVTDPEFAEWVKASKVRSSLYAAADAQFDYDAADELLSTWKQINATKAAKSQAMADEIKDKRDKTLKAANTDMGSGTGESSKKTYSQAAIRELMRKNPTKYQALVDSGELAAAYNEGRVK